MYRVYAQAFFIISVLLAIVIFFNPEERFPFLGKVDVYVFLVAMMLFASFPIAMIGRYLLRAKKLVFQVRIRRIDKALKFLKSKPLKLASNVFGFLLVLLVCVIFLWFLMGGFGKFISRPFFDALTKFFIRNTVQETLSEMDFYTTRSLNQGDFEELKSSLGGMDFSIETMRDYLKQEEFNTFLEKGAREETSYFYGIDADGDKVELVFNLWEDDPFQTNRIDEFEYRVNHKITENEDGKEIMPPGPSFSFKIRSEDDPKLNLETFEVPNEAGWGILVVWWNSNDFVKYVIFGPVGGIDYLLGTWDIECLVGCGYPVSAEERPTFIVSENEKTGETEYIIKTGERYYPHWPEPEDAGYAVTVNELGGLDIERLEKR